MMRDCHCPCYCSFERQGHRKQGVRDLCGKSLALHIFENFLRKLCVTPQGIAAHMENYSLPESPLFALTNETKNVIADSLWKLGEASKKI